MKYILRYSLIFIVPVVCYISECIYGTVPGDSSVFRYDGWVMASGFGGYVGAWDHKGPMVYALNALGYLLIPNGNVGPGLVYMLLWLSSAYMIYRITREMSSETSGILAAVLFSVMGSGVGGGCFQNCVEIIAVFSSLIGFLLLRAKCHLWKCVFFGACVAFSFFAKPNLTSIAFIGVATWICGAYQAKDIKGFLSNCSFSFIGGVIVLIGVSCCFIPHVKEMWDGTLLFNLLEYHKEDISLLNWWLRYFTEGWSITNSGAWILPLFAICLVLSIFVAMRNREMRGECIMLLGWLILESMFALSFKTYYSHYLIVAFVPMSILLGVGCHGQDMKNLRVVFYRAFCIGVIVLFTLSIRAGIRYVRSREPMRQESVRWVDENLKKGERVVVYAGHGVTEMLVCSRHMAVQQIPIVPFIYQFAGGERRASMEREFLNGLQRPDVRYFLSEARLDRVMYEFSGCNEIVDELRSWKLCKQLPFGYVYRRK